MALLRVSESSCLHNMIHLPLIAIVHRSGERCLNMVHGLFLYGVNLCSNVKRIGRLTKNSSVLLNGLGFCDKVRDELSQLNQW